MATHGNSLTFGNGDYLVVVDRVNVRTGAGVQHGLNGGIQRGVRVPIIEVRELVFHGGTGDIATTEMWGRIGNSHGTASQRGSWINLVQRTTQGSPHVWTAGTTERGNLHAIRISSASGNVRNNTAGNVTLRHGPGTIFPQGGSIASGTTVAITNTVTPPNGFSTATAPGPWLRHSATGLWFNRHVMG